MADPNNDEPRSRNSDKNVPIILRNPGKAILRAGLIGFVGGLISGIIFALLSLTAPKADIEPANVIQQHPALFTIIASALGFGVLGMGLGVTSWISTKLQPKKF